MLRMMQRPRTCTRCLWMSSDEQGMKSASPYDSISVSAIKHTRLAAPLAFIARSSSSSGSSSVAIRVGHVDDGFESGTPAGSSGRHLVIVIVLSSVMACYSSMQYALLLLVSLSVAVSIGLINERERVGQMRREGNDDDDLSRHDIMNTD